MANHLDLEEQEQLDQLKAFWKQYGNLISWVLIAALGAFAGWNLYQRWQIGQSNQAAAMYDELESVIKAGDISKLDRAIAKKLFSTTQVELFSHQILNILRNMRGRFMVRVKECCLTFPVYQINIGAMVYGVGFPGGLFGV